MADEYKLEGTIESIIPNVQCNRETNNGNPFYYIVIRHHDKTQTEDKTHPVKVYGIFFDALSIMIGDYVKYRHSRGIDTKNNASTLSQVLEIQQSPNQKIFIRGFWTDPLPEEIQDQHGMLLY